MDPIKTSLREKKEKLSKKLEELIKRSFSL